MLVPMMEVREVSVLVVYGLMKVFMRVRLGSVGSRDVLILVMSALILMVLVMIVQVGMKHPLVKVPVLVPLRQMKPNPHAHKDRRDLEPKTERLVEKQKRDNRAYEWGQRKVSPGPRRPKVAQG